jgi:hypothetical protein
VLEDVSVVVVLILREPAVTAVDLPTAVSVKDGRADANPCVPCPGVAGKVSAVEARAASRPYSE